MTNLRYYIITIALCVLCADYSYSQGCSDAGLCTMNSFKPHSHDSTEGFDNQIKVGAFFGRADNSISVFGNYVEYNRRVSKKLGLDAKLTTTAQSGNGITVFGLSDIFLNANYSVSELFALTLGIKIPLSKAKGTHDNGPLPMDYQSSLGTFDLLFGFGYTYETVQLVAALQIPLTQNENNFLAGAYPIDSRMRAFQSTKNYQRSGDVLFRVSYPIIINSEFRITPSILPIYHLTNDKYTDEFYVEREISGSQGLTLNGNLYVDYEVGRESSIQLNVGIPFMVRDARPDGLTRSIAANVEYRIKF